MLYAVIVFVEMHVLHLFWMKGIMRHELSKLHDSTQWDVYAKSYCTYDIIEKFVRIKRETDSCNVHGESYCTYLCIVGGLLKLKKIAYDIIDEFYINCSVCASLNKRQVYNPYCSIISWSVEK